MNFVKKLVPVKTIVQYFLQRFVGKYIDEDNPIDLSQASFDADEVILKDLNLNCRVSFTVSLHS